MTRIHAMTPWSLRTAVTPDTEIYEKKFREELGIQNFVIWLINSSEIALQSQNFDIFFKNRPKYGSGT